MTVVKGARMLSQQKPCFSILDHDKCNKLIESLEKYSYSLDSLLQQTPKIENTILKEK